MPIIMDITATQMTTMTIIIKIGRNGIPANHDGPHHIC
jgi:hypothetical protein